MWEIRLFDGDPEDPETPQIVETAIAFNHVEAIRLCGGRQAVVLPRPLFFVTWPEDDPEKLGRMFRIDSTAGPDYSQLAVPSITLNLEEEW